MDDKIRKLLFRTVETARHRMEEAGTGMEKEKDAAQRAAREGNGLLFRADTFDEANAEGIRQTVFCGHVRGRGAPKRK